MKPMLYARCPSVGLFLSGAILAVALPMAPVDAQHLNKAGKPFPEVKLKGVTKADAIPGALGTNLTDVADWYGYTEASFRKLLREDKAVKADRSGRLLYTCEGLVAAADPALDSATVTQTNYPAAQTFLLHSRPGASRIVYLDFNGHTTSGTIWNNNFTGGANFTTPPYDIDGNTGSFSATELARIQGIWKRVAEDFMPYDVDVTTEDPGVEALRKSTSTDPIYGVRVCIGGSSYSWYGAGAGGVAYVGSFNWNSDSPCFVFTAQLGTGNEKYTAEAASHEVGHTLGLRHDGTTAGVEYYQGHGAWAPIMGVGYYRDVTQWSKGEYTAANNTEDDLAKMVTYGAPLRADDHANTIVAATPLAGWQVAASGVIASRTDVDVFEVLSGAGSVLFTASPATPSPNLDIQLALYNGAGNLVLASNSAGLGCALSAVVPAGTYYVAVDGIGAGSPTTSYNDYGSEGEYALTGLLVPSGNQPPVASVAGTTPTSGTAPLTVNFSSASSYDPDGSVVAYDWDFGDGTGSTEPNPTKTYSAPGSYAASLVVFDNEGLSASKSVTITVLSPPPPAPALRVAKIVLSKAKKNGVVTVTAAVTVTDAAGKVLQNATVTGAWSGAVAGTASAKTDKKGVAKVKSAGTKATGTVTFTVSNITLSGYAYNASLNLETSDSIAVP